MFNRTYYKAKAREQLKGKLKTPLIAYISIYIIIIIIFIMEIIIQCRIIDTYSTLKMGFITYLSISFCISFLSSLLICLLVFPIYRIFIQIYNTKIKVKFLDFLKGFSHLPIYFAGAFRYILFTTLWSLLFIFPGIIKSYSYSQMFFVLAENPKLSSYQAMKISKILTRKHKADLFFMDLSFVGWYFLSFFTFAIIPSCFFIVVPNLNIIVMCFISILSLLSFIITSNLILSYEIMAFTNAYYALKEETLKTGTLTPLDFSTGLTTVL